MLVTFYITVIKIPDSRNLVEKRSFGPGFQKAHSSWRGRFACQLSSWCRKLMVGAAHMTQQEAGTRG